MSNDHMVQNKVNEIGQKVRMLRESRGLSGYELGLRSNVSSSVIARIEKGKREPRLSTLLKIIEGFEQTPAEFFKSFDKRTFT